MPLENGISKMQQNPSSVLIWTKRKCWDGGDAFDDSIGDDDVGVGPTTEHEEEPVGHRHEHHRRQLRRRRWRRRPLFCRRASPGNRVTQAEATKLRADFWLLRPGEAEAEQRERLHRRRRQHFRASSEGEQSGKRRLVAGSTPRGEKRSSNIRLIDSSGHPPRFKIYLLGSFWPFVISIVEVLWWRRWWKEISFGLRETFVTIPFWGRTLEGMGATGGGRGGGGATAAKLNFSHSEAKILIFVLSLQSPFSGKISKMTSLCFLSRSLFAEKRKEPFS